LNLPRSQKEWKRLDEKIASMVELENWIVRAQNDTDIDATLTNWTERLYDIALEMFGAKQDRQRSQYTARTRIDPILRNTKEKKKELRRRAKEANTKGDRIASKIMHARLVREENKYLRRKAQNELDIDQRKEEKRWRKDPWKMTKQCFTGEEEVSGTPSNTTEEIRRFYERKLTDEKYGMQYTKPDWMPEAPFPTTNVINDCITIEQLQTILKRKNIRASTGHDRLSYGIFKWCPSTQPTTIFILNRFKSANKYPKSFKYGRMVLALKPRKDSLDIKNFRPITLTTCLSKIYNTILFDYAAKHIQGNKYLNTEQKAFMRGVSGCVEHHFLFDKLLSNLTGSHRLFLLMTDLKGAFDTVRHSLIDLLSTIIISLHGLRRRCLTYIEISIRGLKPTTRVLKIQIGVIQGDVLSVILFLIVLNLGLKPNDTHLTSAPQMN